MQTKIVKKVFSVFLPIFLAIPLLAKQKRIGEGKSLAYQDYMTWIVLTIAILSFAFYLGGKIRKIMKNNDRR